MMMVSTVGKGQIVISLRELTARVFESRAHAGVMHPLLGSGA